MTTDLETRERIGHLYDYLSALAQEVYAKPVRQVSDHDVTVAPADIPRHPSVSLGPNGSAAWLRVAKTPRPVPPPRPESFAALLRLPDDPYTTPQLPPEVSEEIAEEFDAWVAEVWEPWAETARPAVDARSLYETLFRLRQRLRADEATHELVWGHGVLGWRFGGQAICHPLLITQARIVFDEDTGELSVVPDGLPALELDCLQGLGVPDLGRLAQIGDELRDDPVDVWSEEDTRRTYGRILAPLGLDDRIESGPGLPATGDSPVMAATWRLLVRRRRVMFLRFFEQLKEAVAGRHTLPAPVVDLASGERPTELAADWAGTAERLLMPLAANDEQEQIARKLATHSGVTVQGPPGTGKSHTIANLVSHLVAHGKRVLVTAHKDQALAVLREKIPAELRDLSLAVLGSSSADLTELQRSVQAITAAADSVDEGRETEATEALRTRLDEVALEVAQLRRRLRQGLEREQSALSLSGRSRRAPEVADWLARNQAELARIPDPLTLQAGPPLTTAELAELFSLVGRISAADAAAALTELPPPASPAPHTGGLPDGVTLAGRHDEIARLGEALAAYRDYAANLPAVDAMGDAALTKLVDATAQAAGRLNGLQADWLMKLRTQVAQARQWYDLWSGHARLLAQDVQECARHRAELAGSQVGLPQGTGPRELLNLLTQLEQRYAEGKKVSPLMQRDLAGLLKTVTVDGEPPQTAAEVRRAIAFVRLQQLRTKLVRLWSAELVSGLGAPPAPTGFPAVETWIDGHVQAIHNALDWEINAWPALRRELIRLVARETVPAQPGPADLQRLAGVLAGLRARGRQRTLQTDLQAIADSLAAARARPGASTLWGELQAALAARDWARWDAALASAARLRALTPATVRMNELLNRLSVAAPRWTRLIRDTDGDVERCGDPALLPELWEWRQADTWLGQIIAADDLAEVQRRLDETQEEQRRLTLDLTKRSAWLAMKRGLGHEERQALVGWLQTLRKIGRGTGVSANKWRAEAQRLMPRAMGAVPVWIMPYYRVAESFDPLATPPFDVVIVDESSQCDVFALGLLGLGHKVVIVGDDKQISPSAVGVNRSRVDQLIQAHLRDFPNALLLDLESSLYDASVRLFPGVVRLREHFRCLPRIIEFSSQHYYAGSIQPLREEGADRLPGPAVRAVYVADGVRTTLGAGDVNEPEAAALIDLVVDCCNDPAYDGRTMGVISLLGSSRQAQYIDERLLHKLGPEEYERRRLRCGDSYSFQGDERDVVFVTVVADDNRSAATSKTYEQRINVAASRARDQLWVFHSVQPDELHPDDQRAKLIRYAADPRSGEAQGVWGAALKGDIDGVRATELRGELEARCESDFERRVLRMLLARDYRVAAQHPVGNLRIDLVVHGGGRRIAVECDGDKFHGPDQWEDDLRRQQVLERLGWRFWRVRGSVFYRDPESALATLWPLLNEAGITPGG